MNRLLPILIGLLLAPNAVAQLPQIRVTGLFPPGAQRGTTVDVTITAGKDLDEASALIFSDPKIKATPKLDSKGNPIANKFSVAIDAAVEPGLYDVRLRGLFGISNPRIFRVDTIAEVEEKEPNNTDEQAQEVGVNTIVNARANSAADVDTFLIKVKADKPLVIRSEAARIDSLMQPVLELFDSSGRRVAHSRRRKQQDAVIVYTSESDQDVKLKVHDTVYAGSNDYVYRLSIDERPLVDFVTPSIVSNGTDVDLTLYGRHLPGGKATDRTLNGQTLFRKPAKVKINNKLHSQVGIDSASADVATTLYHGIDGNLIPLALGNVETPAIEETESDPPGMITAPVQISGSFDTELDEDTYRFDAKKGDQWQIDVLAERLGSSADPLMIVEQVVKAADGKETLKRLAREEKGKQNPGGNNLSTLTRDPSFLFTVPADGQYQVRMRDRYAASRGDAGLRYTLSIQKPVRNFNVVIFDSLPSADGKALPASGAISLRKGGTYQIPIYAYRTGGHNEDIHIVAKGIPGGVRASGGLIPAGKNSATLVLTAPADAKETTGHVFFMGVSGPEGSVITTGAKVVTLAHAGANGLPRTARVSKSLLLNVMKDEEPFHIQPGVVSADMTQDQQLLIPLKLVRRAGFDAKVDITFAGQPKNVDVPKVAIDKGIDSTVARFYFKENASLGSATLLMYATAKVPYRRNPWLAERAKVKVTQAAEKLAAEKEALADSKVATETTTKKIAEIVAMQKQLGIQLAAEIAAQKMIQDELKKAIAGKTAATTQLVALQAKLNTATANIKPEAEDVDAALKEVTDATNALTEATKPVAELIAKINVVGSQVAAKQKLVDEKNKLIAAAKVQVAEQQKAMEAAKAAVTTAEAALKAAEAQKTAADAAAKKAADATKPKALNLRTIAVPVHLKVSKTPGKVTAAVPNKGVIKKGTSVDVKVTIVRKNKFAGAVKVALVLPAGTGGLTSNTADIPADKTEAVLKFTAAADAAPGDIANAVVRATAEFEGRTAQFDAPVTLKITE